MMIEEEVHRSTTPWQVILLGYPLSDLLDRPWLLAFESLRPEANSIARDSDEERPIDRMIREIGADVG